MVSFISRGLFFFFRPPSTCVFTVSLRVIPSFWFLSDLFWYSSLNLTAYLKANSRVNLFFTNSNILRISFSSLAAPCLVFAFKLA